jgi:hypothetical protein
VPRDAPAIGINTLQRNVLAHNYAPFRDQK